MRGKKIFPQALDLSLPNVRIKSLGGTINFAIVIVRKYVIHCRPAILSVPPALRNFLKFFHGTNSCTMY